MHEFPPIAELNTLVGETLWRVRLDPNGIQFLFDPSQITVAFAVEHIEPNGAIWRCDCEAFKDPPNMLHRLIGKIVASVEVEPLRLKIRFDNRAQLHLLSEIVPYECGHIIIGGKFIVF